MEVANEVKRKIAIIAPLDWGLGHLTRSIALANFLTTLEFEVFFAVPTHLRKYLNEYPYQIIPIAGYNVKYYKHCHPIVSLLIQIPKFVFTIFRERSVAKKIIKEYNPSLLISDNRPFFRMKGIASYYLTHQLQLPLKKPFRKIIHLLYHHQINRFDGCIVPDIRKSSEGTLSGKLSNTENIKVPVYYCGILSRFHAIAPIETEIEYKILFIASGPQPERNGSIEVVSRIFSALPHRFAIVGCNEVLSDNHKPANVDFFKHLPQKSFAELTQKSEILLAKSGYTTIMDAVALNKPLIMWPTRGQWEQEYLARHLKDFPGVYVLDSPNQLLSFNFSKIQKPKDKPTINLDKSIKTIFYGTNQK